jgi:hypothetical protein
MEMAILWSIWLWTGLDLETLFLAQKIWMQVCSFLRAIE